MCGISIISNNCIAGAICHDLGMQFATPTVSIQIMPEEYPKFCENINEYMGYELQEYKKEDLSDFHKQCLMRLYGEVPDLPYGKCGDILVVLRHYPNFIDGKEKWERRRKRFNPDCVGFIFYVFGENYKNEADTFASLGLKNSLILTENFDMDVPIEHYRINTIRQTGFLDYDENGNRYYANTFDASKWINKI